MSGGVRAFSIAAVVAVALLLSVGVVAAAWLPDYDVRVPVTLTGGSSGAQTNYQLNLSISYDSDMQADFDDLRFTKADGTTLLDAWLENKTDSTSAEVWVNFTTTPANGVDQTYYMYYGNSGASSAWSGADTFIMFDDFDFDSGWTTTAGTWTVSAGKKDHTGSVRTAIAYYDTVQTITSTKDFAIIYNAYSEYNADLAIVKQTSWNCDENGEWQFLNYYDNNYQRFNSAGGQVGNFGTWTTSDTWVRIRYISGESKFYVDASTDGTTWTNKGNATVGVMMVAGSNDYYFHILDDSNNWGNGWFEHIRYTNYATNPATSAFGSEQFASDSIIYNATQPYNHTISSDGLIMINRSATGSTDTNWTAAAASSDSFLILTGYDKTGDTVGEFTLSGGSLDWLQVTNLSGSTAYGMKTGGSIGEIQTTNAAGEANFTTDISAGSYDIVVAEYPPADPVGLASDTGNFWVNHTWEVGADAGRSGWYLISGEYDGPFNGFNWTDSTWQGDSAIASGLGDVGDNSAPATFNMDGTWYLISGDSAGGFHGFNWTDSTWQGDSGIVSGLGDIGDYSKPIVFKKDGTWYLISGGGDGPFNGFNWTGSTWQGDSAIVSGLGDVGLASTTAVFQKGETWYLIAGELDGPFNGFNWTDSTWQGDSAIASGLGDVGARSAPTVFQKDGTWYLISGEGDGVFNGFNWTGSTWQGDSAIASGLGDVGGRSAPSTFHMGYATDSFNVSVNDVWNNGTTVTYNNTTYSAHAWQNITVWAYNSTGIGALSENSVSQDTRIPNNAITITNTGDWSGGVGGTVSVDYDASDADSDTPVFSCNRTDLFTNFNTGTGVGSWTAAAGIYYVDFGVSDGYGSTDNYTMTITVGAIPPDPAGLANATGNFWVNHTWSAGAGNVTDSFNVSVNSVWNNGTTATFNNTTYSAHAWQNITVYAYNTSGNGTLSSGSAGQDTRIPNNAITITNVSDVEDFVDRNLFVDCDATDADSDTPTFSCNRTDLFTDFSTVTGRGNWTMVTGLYYVDFGVGDGYGSTNNSTIEILVKAALTPPPDIRDGVFGFLNASVPDNDTIDRYKADDILTVESSLDWDAITSGAWGTYKNSVLYCYDVNRRSGLRMSCDGDYSSSVYIATVTANITTYMPDLKADPYQTAVQFIAINLSNTTSPDKADFVNAVAQNVSEQTDNKIKILTLETIAGLEAMYVAESPVIYKSLSTVSNWIDFEAVTLRGNSTKSRIYSSNESFMSDLSDYRTRVFSRMRNLHNTSDQYTESHSVKVIGGDLILYNSGAAKANKTVASAVAGEYWDVWNDTLFNNTGGGTVGFWLDGESYTYVAREDSFEKIVIQNNNSSLLGSTPTITEALRFYSNGSMTDSWLWAGDDTDIKVELWDPTYIKDNLFMCHYAWINASWISNYTLYDYIIIADKNSNEITNTINRSNNTYGYISVADYANTQGWIDDKKVEVDDWADNYSTNIFLDGIDFVVGGTNFSARMKVLADYIMNDKDKSLILNTYTAYSDFATYGDAVMKESCFARWDGNVNSPTYSYEDMDIEKDRADYYTSHNIPVLGMSFGDVEDFDKMAYCAAAFAVLYGFDGDNCYRYGQPNFQSQKDINIYDFGNMLESAYIETSATDWNRLYVAGRVHIDPVAHTWYIDDDKTVTNISVDIGLYSGATGSGDRNIYLYANDLSTQHSIPYYAGTDPVGSWTERSAYLDADEHTEHGHYYVYFYTRPITGGWNFLGKHETNLFHPGYHSWYDTTSEDLPYTITGQTWNGLGRDLNWMVNMTVNYTTTGYVDELVDRITQGTSSSVTGGTVSHTTVIESERDCAIPVWGIPVGSIIAHTGATTSVNNSTGTWIAIDVDPVDDADAGTITWNYTAVDGEDYGAVREFVSTGNYIYRYLMPHLSTHEILTSSDTPTPPDPTGLANSTGNFWINHTWSAGAGNVTDSFNISLNDVWNNGTTATSNNTTYSAHAWQNITVYAYNVSGDGTLSTGNVSQDTQIPNNAITITNTSDWSGEMGGNVYVDYDATDADSDTPTFSCNRTDLFTDFSTASGTGNWTAAPGVYYVDFGVSDGYGSTSNYTMTITANATPPDPANLANTTGNFWVNHTWSAGAGNVTDSFNISVNDVWNNGTTDTSNNTTYSAHAWQNITVYAWNTSAGGTLSTGSAGQDTRIPNNAITITNTSDWSGEIGANVYVDYDATDPDSDTPTFSCNRTDLFTDFDTADGTGNWTAAPGIFYVDFGVSDGYGSIDNYTMTITVGAIPPDPTGIANSTGNFWVNHTWSAGAGNVTDSYNVSVNTVWHNATATAHWNNTGMSPHGWSNTTVYAYNASGDGTLSAGSVSQDTRIPNNPVTITNTSDWSGEVGANVHVDYDRTDADSDTPAFSCNRTDLFTDFSTVTGQGNWTSVEGTYYVDFGVSDGWGSTDNYTMTITATSGIPEITLVSFTPATLLTNYTGLVNVSFGVSHNDSGLNLTSLAFLYGVNYTITSNYNNTIRAPANEICAEMGGHGKILRGHNRNITPYLTWENNNTITGGDIYTWGGGDHNSTWITTNVINSTYTFINISENVNKVFPNMAYLGRNQMFEAEKTGFAISKSNSLITRMWDVEKLNGRTNNFYISMYFDTDIGATTPSDDVIIWWCNGSYDPLVDDYETCPFCDQLEAWNVTRWMDHEYVPHANASYAKPLVVNATPLLTPSPDVSNYIIFASNTVSAKPFYLNVTNADPGITNRTFAQTETCWNWNEIASSVSAYAYTPSAFYTFVRDYEELEIQLYVAGNNSLWGASGIHNKSIGLSQYPVGPASFEYFNMSCPTIGYTHDTMMDATYDSGYMHVGIQCPADPDGSVTHNLTLHYLNQTLVGTINNTFTTTGTEDVEINFTTSTYYSTTDLYTLKCVSTDEQGSVATVWLDSYFTLAADGTQGWVMNDMLLFWGMNNIPTLYATVANSSLISYDAGGDIYTMHVPFFKSKCNDTFRFNETVHLQSLNTEDVAYFRFAGKTIFDNATVHGWNTTTDTIAPDTDAYRGYMFSCCRTCGNITNCNLSYLGSDVYRQEGLNFANNPLDYLIYNTTLSHNSRGVILEDCAGVNISHCTITDNEEAGIGIYFTSNTTVQYTNVIGNGRAGVRLYGAHNTTIQHNNVSNSGRHGLRTGLSTNTTINNNTVLNSGRRGVWIEPGSHNTTITNLTLNGVGFGYGGIYTKLSSYITVRDTTITDVQGSHPGNLTCGIDVNDCTDLTIDNVTFSDVWFCDVDCWNTSRVELTDCYGVSSIGFYLSVSPYATIRNNTWVPSPASTAKQGISLSTGCNHSTIADNTAGPAEDYAIMLWKTSHVTIENNSCTHNITGQDYTIGENCTNVTIRDPHDSANLVKVWDTATVKIENTDNQVFAEDSLNQTYAYPTNFTMTLSGVAQTFNLTQTDLTATPASDRLLLWNTVDTGIVSFNATNNTANPQAWFNVTKAAWQNTNITVYRDDIDYYNNTADANGFFPYHYTGGWSEHWFLFSPENLAPDKPSLVAPTNGATGQSTNPTLQVTVTDPDLDTMDVKFYQQGGSQIGSTQTGIASGGTASVVWSSRSYSTTYYWYAVADDGNATTQSDTWHFTTQSSGSSHAITINDCNNRNAPEGGTIYNNFNYTNADPDAPVFTTNASSGSLDSGTGIFSWTTGAGDEGIYTWWFRVANAYGNSDTCTVTFTVTHTDIGDPTNLANTTGNFWVKHTWDAGIKTDTFNVSVNTTWHNGTTNEYWNNTPMSPHGWSNISLAGYNTTNGNLSSFIGEDTRIPNNPVTITNTSDWDGDTYDIVSVNFDSTDADSDTPTYSCSRMDLFTNFNTTDGTGNWTATPSGIYTVDFGVTDGWGSTSNYSMRIAVGAGGIQTETKVPVSIFIALLALMFCLITYVYYAKSHISRIFTTLIAAWMAFMLSQMIVSGNVVQTFSALNSADVWTHDTVAIQIPGLSYLLLFIAVILSIFFVKFGIMFGLEVLREAQREDM